MRHAFSLHTLRFKSTRVLGCWALAALRLLHSRRSRGALPLCGGAVRAVPPLGLSPRAILAFACRYNGNCNFNTKPDAKCLAPPCQLDGSTVRQICSRT